MIGKRILRLAGGAALIVLTPLGLLAACQSRLIYFPRPYPAGHPSTWAEENGGRILSYETSQGTQRAFLQGNLAQPRNLWLVVGGNATLALEWSAWLARNGPAEDAWLLVDFPGYGANEGEPNPERIRQSLQTVLPAAMGEFGWSADRDAERLRFFGHSLGAAACLIAASDFDIRRGVMLAPFTSTMDMGRAITGLPVGFVVRHRFDNVERLEEITSRGPAEVVILHGDRDRAIPIRMSRQLAAEFPRSVSLLEIPGANHDNVPLDHRDALAQALRRIGEPPGE